MAVASAEASITETDVSSRVCPDGLFISKQTWIVPSCSGTVYEGTPSPAGGTKRIGTPAKGIQIYIMTVC